MARLATWSVLLRQPQLANNIMEETNARTSSGELDAGVHHQGSFWGNTRIVVGDGGNKKVVMSEDEWFDESMIPL
jgi:hypothetical protein